MNEDAILAKIGLLTDTQKADLARQEVPLRLEVKGIVQLETALAVLSIEHERSAMDNRLDAEMRELYARRSRHDRSMADALRRIRLDVFEEYLIGSPSQR